MTDSSSSIEEQNVSVFGTCNEALTDALTEYVKKAIESGVKSLPLLQDPEKSKALVDMIEKPYMKHIDLMEAYGRLNIFNLRQWAPRRRQKIVERFLNQANSEREEVQASETTVAPVIAKYPSKEEIPSQEELESIQAEVLKLSVQLKKATDRRNALIEQGASLEVVQAVTENAVEALQQAEIAKTEDQADAVQGPVTAAVMGGQGLQDLNREGKRLQSDLEERKRENPDDDLLDPTSVDALPTHKKRALTMEEEYQRERQVISTTVENLSSLSNMLKQSKQQKTN